MALAGGDALRAAALGGAGWADLADGDRMAALETARAARDDPSMALLEAEAMIASGAIVAGLQRLDALHRTANPAATFALARRRHALADYAGAQRAARALPMHAGAALIGARAALANDQIENAFGFLDPLLHGVAPLPDSVTAGGRRRARRIGACPCPPVRPPGTVRDPPARNARLGRGHAAAGGADRVDRRTWQRRLGALGRRLAVACGGASGARARERQSGTGPHGGAARRGPGRAVAVHPGLLSGEFSRHDGMDSVFAEAGTVHLWRTHPHRWQPWIDAALETAATITVYDLAADVVPAPADVPQAVLDDGALVECCRRSRPGFARAVPASGSNGRWANRPASGHEWPREEMRRLAAGLPEAATPDGAAVRIAGEEFALRRAREGRPTLVVAPPGDPFWAGPLPERAWPAMRVLRQDPSQGWTGAAERAIALAHDIAPEIACSSKTP